MTVDATRKWGAVLMRPVLPFMDTVKFESTAILEPLPMKVEPEVVPE